jgi:hypothetical protein
MSAKDVPGALTADGGTVGGDLNVVTSLNRASPSGGVSVGGTSIVTQIYTQHTHVVGTPDFPAFDTSVFAQYATNTYGGATGGTLANIRVPPNTNPKFTGNVTIRGILYVQSPNTVEFQATPSPGFIVFRTPARSPTT